MSFPSDSQFFPVTLNGVPVGDPVSDVSPASTDIVGNAQFPAAYVSYDTIYVYFRLRLNGDPRAKTGFDNFAWGVLFNTDNNPATYEWVLAVNGQNASIDLIENKIKVPNTFNDPAEGIDGKGTPAYTRPIINFDLARVKPTGDGSRFGGNENYFLDFFIPASVLFGALGITSQTPLQFIFFSSANNNNFNKDFLIPAGSTFTSGFSDPVAPQGFNAQARLVLAKTLTSSPGATVLTGQVASYTGTLAISNQGKSQANAVLVTDAFGLDTVSSLTVSGVTQGLSTVNLLGSTISWNAGNLAPGQTVTLTFTVQGAFLTAGDGSRILNTAAGTGFDSLTGQVITAGPATSSIAVVTAGGVTGTVYNGMTALPLAGAALQLANAQNQVPVNQTSGTGGAYGFSNLAPGAYNLTVSFAGFVAQTVPVTVSAGTVTPLDITLRPQPASLSGTVADQAGNVLPGAVIRVQSPFGAIVAETTADAAGQYRLSVPAGTYTVIATANGFQSEVDTLQLQPAQSVSASFNLAALPGTVSGVITVSGTGTPLAGALVEALNERGQQIAAAVSAADGSYAINSLAPGNYRIRASEAAFTMDIAGAAVRAGQTATVNIGLSPAPGTLTGQVTDALSGVPLSGAVVHVVTVEGITAATTVTDAGGTYVINSLQPANYTITFSETAYASQTTGVSIAPGAQSVLNIALQQLAGSITGMVTDLNGNPLENAVVRVFMNSFVVATLNADQNGQFDIHGLAPGSYMVRAETPGYQRQLIGAFIQPGETVEVDFALAPQPGTLTGTVTAGTSPVPGAVLVVRQTDNSVIGRTITSADGTYVLEELAPGTYTAAVFADGLQTQIKGFSITAGQTTTVSFNLEPLPGIVAGTVYNASTNQLLADIPVAVRIVDTNGLVIQSLFTDQFGAFTAPNLAPGSYTAIVSSTDFQTNLVSFLIAAGQTTTIRVGLIPSPGQISGTVTDAGMDTGISGAAIRISNYTGTLIATVLTDSSGYFRAEGLAPDTYIVTASQTGFQQGSIGAIVSSGQTTTTGLSLLPLPGSVGGAISPAVDGTVIQIYDRNNLLINEELVTAGNGTFRFDSLAPGAYIVTATPPGYALAKAGTVVEAGRESSVSLTLFPLLSVLTGRITDTAGSPLDTAVIRILDGNETLLGTGHADANGAYVVDNIPAGNHFLVVAAPGFSTVILGVGTLPGVDLTGIDIRLVPDSGSVSGQITNASDGSPIPSATVLIRSADVSNLLIATATSSLFGNFFVSGLSPGAYTVVAEAKGFAAGTAGAVVVSDQETAASLALRPLSGVVTGSITDRSGAILTGSETQIKIFNEAGILLFAYLADADGRFTTPELAPGSYVLTASAPGFASASVLAAVTAGSAGTVTLVLTQQNSLLTGNVINRNGSAPVPGSIVTLLNAAGQTVDQSVADLSGNFTIDNVTAGAYTLSVTCDGFGSTSLGVVLRPGQTTAVTVPLEPSPGSVSGFVIDRVTSAPLAGADVRIEDAAGVPVNTVQTDSSGFYLFNNLRSGDYKVTAEAAGFGSQNGGAPVAPGRNTDYSFALSPLRASLSGTVNSAAGARPLAGVLVEVRQLNTYGTVLTDTTTDAAGRYTLGGLPAGNYTAVFSLSGFGQQTDAFYAAPGQNTVVDARLSPTSNDLNGTVVTPPTVPVFPPPPVVDVYDDRNTPVVTVPTDPSGQFTADGIAAGDYTVVVQKPGLSYSQQVVTVVPGFTPNVVLSPGSPPLAVTGAVLDDSTGNPVPGASVQILNENLTPIDRTLADGTGVFLLGSLRPGSYTVTVSSELFGSKSAAVSLAAGTPAPPVTVALNPLFGTLTGTVTDRNGRLLSNVFVQLFDPSGLFLRNVTTSTRGVYTVTNLAPGFYSARYTLEDKQPAVRTLIIAANETTVLNVVLEDDTEE
ncbi:carboxypeptidase regulatory-like domain-containing protein [Paenibacillus sp. RC84]|uniref:carboxypeptidase regulatory-like domain-containing protein n=1 Tax=Paenibacillus sp. RC84 TaxID=3156252 RepID=UPI0035164472